MIAFYLTLILGMAILMHAINKSCISGHNYVDKGKYVICTKCRAVIIKKQRQ